MDLKGKQLRNSYDKLVTLGNNGGLEDGDGNTVFYEQGQWQPGYSTTGAPFDSISYRSPTGGFYVRIRNILFFTGVIRTSSITIGSASGDLLLSGFPYVSSNDPAERGGGYITNGLDMQDKIPEYIYIGNSTDEHLLKIKTDQNNYSNFSPNDLKPNGDNYLFFTGHIFII